MPYKPVLRDSGCTLRPRRCSIGGMLLYMLASPVPVVVYPFKHRRDWDGKWIHSRYKAGLDEIAARYDEWEITGPPETRWPVDGSFSPWRSSG